jgi:hypothetical protein
MSRFAIRLLTLAVYATALALVPTVTSAKAETSSSKHLKKHQKQKRPGFGHRWSAGQPWPVARPPSPAGLVCPGMGRSFDCRVWPPPFDEDPDQKISGRH